jgi:hypothetical protein
LFEIHWHKFEDEVDFFFLDQDRDQIDNVRVLQFFQQGDFANARNLVENGFSSCFGTLLVEFLLPRRQDGISSLRHIALLEDICSDRRFHKSLRQFSPVFCNY